MIRIGVIAIRLRSAPEPLLSKIADYDQLPFTMTDCAVLFGRPQSPQPARPGYRLSVLQCSRCGASVVLVATPLALGLGVSTAADCRSSSDSSLIALCPGGICSKQKITRPLAGVKFLWRILFHGEVAGPGRRLKR